MKIDHDMRAFLLAIAGGAVLVGLGVLGVATLGTEALAGAYLFVGRAVAFILSTLAVFFGILLIYFSLMNASDKVKWEEKERSSEHQHPWD